MYKRFATKRRGPNASGNVSSQMPVITSAIALPKTTAVVPLPSQISTLCPLLALPLTVTVGLTVVSPCRISLP
ncbi:hypothetical protein, partial [Pseudomonas sp. IT-P2]|uniref:hypothetical protein n=1 Tax=Pseudomonas sp. IT-P2 TaxID=3026456 RepID=UPI0039DFBBD0